MFVQLPRKLSDFRNIVRKGMFLDPHQEEFFYAIPEKTWQELLENFNDNLELAKRVILNKQDLSEKDNALSWKNQQTIHNLDYAAKQLNEFIDAKKPIMILTDNDNDGSLSQSIADLYQTELKRQGEESNIVSEFCQDLGGRAVRGFSYELVEAIAKEQGLTKDSEFLIVTADNGINSINEQREVLSRYPNAKFIVTDHHIPNTQMVMDNDISVIVNPKYNAQKYQTEKLFQLRENIPHTENYAYQDKNISGAQVLNALLRKSLELKYGEVDPKLLDSMTYLSKASNLLDFVDVNAEDKLFDSNNISDFTSMQSALNSVNGMQSIILHGLSHAQIDLISKKTGADPEKLKEVAEKVEALNKYAHVLVTYYDRLQKMEFTVDNSPEGARIEESTLDKLNTNGFKDLYLHSICSLNGFPFVEKLNENYLEQLRPILFALMAKEKNNYNQELLEVAKDLLINLGRQQSALMNELRKGDLLDIKENDKVRVVTSDVGIGRKLLEKTYNMARKDLNISLSFQQNKVTGAFITNFKIGDILTAEFDALAEKYGVRLTTPGHEQVGGFIVENTQPEGFERRVEQYLDKFMKLAEKRINALEEKQNKLIDKEIEKIKAKSAQTEIDIPMPYVDFFLVDERNINFINDLNKTLRGNLPHSKGVIPIMQLNDDMLITNAKTGEQLTLTEAISNKKYGYVTIKTDFDNNGIIIPTEIVRELAKNNFKDFVKFAYLDDGVLMVNQVVKKEFVQLAKEKNTVLEVTKDTRVNTIIHDVYSDNKLKGVVHYTNDELKYNDFYKSRYGEHNFNEFQNMMVGLLHKSQKDAYVCFDVEATGLSNAQLLNIGAIKYFIEDGAPKLPIKEFKEKLYKDGKNKAVLLEEVKDITDEVEKYAKSGEKIYFKGSKAYIAVSEPLKVHNFHMQKDHVDYNQIIVAEAVYSLIKDHKAPVAISNLTGITNEHLSLYGEPLDECDTKLVNFLKGQNILIGAHNTNYDMRISRANLNKFYHEVLLAPTSQLFDTTNFSASELLIYDNSRYSKLQGVPEIPESLLFNDEKGSTLSLTQFLKEGEGEFPDRTNSARLKFKDNDLYLISGRDEMKVSVPVETLLEQSKVYAEVPLNRVKYSAQQLSNQRMIRNLLIDSNDFNIRLVDGEYQFPKKELVEFQLGYNFNLTFKENLMNSTLRLPSMQAQSDEINRFKKEFLKKNQDLIKVFNDAWFYKAILTEKDPKFKDLNNDTYEIISERTGFSPVIVEKVLKEAYEFKKKHNLDEVIQHEIHVNGPLQGDILFETYLTLELMSEKRSNTMLNDYNFEQNRNQEAVNLVDEYSKKYDFTAKKMFTNYRLLDDSMGVQQLLRMEKETSEIAQKTHERHEQLQESSPMILRFGLGSNVLQPGSCIQAITRPDASFTEEELKEDVNKIKFIMQVKQIARSDLLDSSLMDKGVYKTLTANKETIAQYQKDLLDRYSYLEMSNVLKSEKDLIDTLKIAFDGEEVKEKVIKKRLEKWDLPLYAYKDAINELKAREGENNSIGEMLTIFEDFVHNNPDLRTSVEQAFIDKFDAKDTYKPSESFDELINQEGFLKDNVTRKNPVEYMAKHFNILNLTLNGYKQYKDRPLKFTLEQNMINAPKMG